MSTRFSKLQTSCFLEVAIVIRFQRKQINGGVVLRSSIILQVWAMEAKNHKMIPNNPKMIRDKTKKSARFG